MTELKRICVFCGSNPGRRPDYLAAARDLGRLLAEEGIELVYGGAGVGLMGEVARSVLGSGGRVIGVLPEFLERKELLLEGLSELRVVGSMHERKALMAELSQGIIAMPGGLGTLEEFCEMLTWGQLGLSHRPCALLNVAGFYDGLCEFFDHMLAQGFLRVEHRSAVLCADDPHELLRMMRSYRPKKVGKWIAWSGIEGQERARG